MTGVELLSSIVRELGALQETMVFTGGLVLPLYLERQPSLRLRPTIDADAVVACASYPRWAALQAELMQRGFAPASDGDAPICRMRTPGGYLLDVMPIDPTVLGFGNRWFRSGYERATLASIGKGVHIRVFSAPLFAAAKAEAYRDRGIDDPWLSHDLEDVLTLLACRPSLPGEIAGEDTVLQTYLASFAAELLASDRFEEVVDSHVRDQSDEALAALVEIARLA